MHRWYRSGLEIEQRIANVNGLVEVLRPLMRGVGFIFRGICKIFFSWWMNPRLAHSIRRSSAEEIEHAFPFLFNQFGAKLVPCPRPEAHDSQMNYVCFATTNVLFEFSNWHREYTAVRVAPTFDPRDSYDLVE